eukprot:1160421-Pelagomonas_calceolata.AAC.4
MLRCMQDAHAAFQAVSGAAKLLQDAGRRTALDAAREDRELRAMAEAEAAAQERARQWRVVKGEEPAGEGGGGRWCAFRFGGRLFYSVGMVPAAGQGSLLLFWCSTGVHGGLIFAGTPRPDCMRFWLCQLCLQNPCLKMPEQHPLSLQGWLERVD